MAPSATLPSVAPLAKSSATVSATSKQVLFCIALIAWTIAFCIFTGALRFVPDPILDTVDPWSSYGFLATLILSFIRLLPLLAVPQLIFNLIGLMRFNAFNDRVTLKSSPLLAPFVCVRVVTRGLYPRLVRQTVTKNLETLADAGFENFVYEVVTDTPVNLAADGNKRVKETVVPSTYKTKTGALNKSRALQYCLEDDVNIMNDDDWIVHLDEETLLTENCVRGILNFICDGKHDFGQGLITYASNPAHFRSWSKFFQNRICTVADSFRVADDMGKQRCQLKIFHKPIFGWKGSYVVTRAGAEKAVTFDNGPEGSKAEDCYFGMVAVDQGRSFDFIEGEMHEKSPFTFADFFRQRKRWMQGIFMVVASGRITVQTKFLLGVSLVSWLTLPISILNLALSKIYPFSMGFLLDFACGFVGAVPLAMYAYGYCKQYPVQRYDFYIVEKELEDAESSVEKPETRRLVDIV